MRENYTHKSRYFYGNEISKYGLDNSRVDYGTLAKSLDMVLCNNITKLFYDVVCGEYIEPEQVNGIIDNSAQIDELNEAAEALFDKQYLLDEGGPEWEAIEKEIEAIKAQIEELEREQDEPREIFQYFIVSDSGARILQELTNEIVYYIPVLDIHVWGVTHFGTLWDYVLTDIKIDLQED